MHRKYYQRITKKLKFYYASLFVSYHQILAFDIRLMLGQAESGGGSKLRTVCIFIIIDILIIPKLKILHQMLHEILRNSCCCCHLTCWHAGTCRVYCVLTDHTLFSLVCCMVIRIFYKNCHSHRN